MRKIFNGRFTGTAAALGSIGPDIQQASNVVFNLVVGGAETVSVAGVYRTHSGSKVSSGKLRPINLVTGAVAASSDLASGDYQLLDVNFEELVFTKSATVETGTVNFRVFQEE